MEENISRSDVDRLLDKIPEKYRENTKQQILYLISSENDPLKAWNKIQETVDSIKKNEAELKSKISEIQKKLGEYNIALEEIRKRLPTFQEKGKKESIDILEKNLEENSEFINNTANINLETMMDNPNVLDAIEDTDNLLQEIEVRKSRTKMIAESTMMRKKIQGVKKEKVKLTPGEWLKNNMASLKMGIVGLVGVGILSLPTVYGASGIVHFINEKNAKGDLAEDYTKGTTLSRSISRDDALVLYHSLEEQGNFPFESFEDFIDYMDQLSEDMDLYVRYQNADQEQRNDILLNEGAEIGLTVNRLENDKDLNKLLKGLIRAKLADQISQSIGEKIALDKIELEHVNRITSGKDIENYMSITYENQKGEKIENRSSTYLLFLLDKNVNGRMEGSFVDLVDIYERLSVQNISMDEMAELYMATMEFVCDKSIQVSKNGKLHMQDAVKEGIETQEETMKRWAEEKGIREDDDNER